VWLPVVLACGTGDGRSGIPDAGGHTFARLSLTVTAPRDAAPQLDATARLLRYAATDVDSAQILAGSRGVVDPMVVGRCVLVDEEALLDETLTRMSPDAAVEMLDAGDLVFRIGAHALVLSPSHQPELIPFVSGAVYETDGIGGDPALELGSADEAYVSAFGGEDVGAFDANVAVPAVPRIAAPASVTLGSWVPVRWTVDAPSEEGVVVSLRAERGRELRCRAADTGLYAVPADWLRSLVDRAQTDVLELSVERAARAPISSSGLEAGELVVTVRDAVPIPVE
jgi:hypothetical protein